jgi:hypothetical protein
VPVAAGGTIGELSLAGLDVPTSLELSGGLSFAGALTTNNPVLWTETQPWQNNLCALFTHDGTGVPPMRAPGSRSFLTGGPPGAPALAGALDAQSAAINAQIFWFAVKVSAIDRLS